MLIYALPESPAAMTAQAELAPRLINSASGKTQCRESSLRPNTDEKQIRRRLQDTTSKTDPAASNPNIKTRLVRQCATSTPAGAAAGVDPIYDAADFVLPPQHIDRMIIPVNENRRLAGGKSENSAMAFSQTGNLRPMRGANWICPPNFESARKIVRRCR